MKLTKLAVSTLAVASVVLSAGIASAQTSSTQTTTTTTSDGNGNSITQTTTTGDNNGNYSTQTQTSTTSNTINTNRGRNNDAATFGGNVQGRYAIANQPLSIRGAVLFGGDSVAIVPTITYDAAIAKNTNLYFGGGYSFLSDEGQASQLGNKNAPVLTLGAESQVAKNTVVYSDAKFGIDAYEGSDADALSLQAGVGYSF